MTTNEEPGVARGVHPDDATLVSWVQGVLPVEAANRLESHIEACDECARRLEEVTAKPDPFLQKLRGAAGLSVTLPGADGPEETLADANLMFGALALQAGLVTAQQLADACVLWSSRGGKPLADLMVEQGWIDEAARNSVKTLLAAKAAPRHRVAAETISSRDPHGLDLNEAMSLTPLSNDRLRLLHLHSHGGIGQVWLAQDTVLGREVALKELLPELRGSKRHRERFLREARVAAQLSHPGTAPVYEYREEGGRCYYTMRFYSGRTLTEAIQQAHAEREKHDEAEAFERLFPLIEQFLTVCDTIAYAHSKGIIHRDLKGENVVLGEFGEVTVIDWGLAKSIDDKEGSVALHRESTEPHKTIEGERLGTPGFMSPEQARGEQSLIDERTDVYGLSAVLYEILTSRPPFTGETANEVMHRVETQPPVRPSALHPSTPDELETICLKGLSKQKEDRYETASDLSNAIRHWVTERLRRRQEFDRQARFYALSHDLFNAMDHQGYIQQVNPAYAKFFGYSDDDLPIGEHYSLRLHPDDRPLVAQRYGSAQRGESQGEAVLRFAGKDGVYRAARFTLSTIPGDPMIYSVGRPVDEESERRRLTDERSRFFSLSHDLCVIYDEHFRIEQLNQALLDFLETDEDTMLGAEGLGCVHPEDKPAVQRHVDSVRDGGSAQDIVCRVITKRGKTHLTNWTLSRVPGEQTLYALGRPLDEQSERRRAHSARARFFTLSPNLFVISDERGRAAQVNPAWKERLGWEAEEIIGQPFHNFVHPDDIPTATRAARRALVREPVVDLDVRMRCKDGAYKTFTWMLTHAPGERANYGIGREVVTASPPQSMA
ncbi:protein kinase domain-containing protein [Botrimarina mediterranea]|uniref:protein kinase domain-containing protein n=1 Tax=Botrimarina mediterranea TaxID=2528022 RepID=UPI001188F27D|nr:Serine/threonine-protein kinase PknD [Planctomycetes bacterium K2D]